MYEEDLGRRITTPEILSSLIVSYLTLPSEPEIEASSFMSNSWLENFLARASQPTYFRSNSLRDIQREFETAQLEEGLSLVDKKILLLERKRKDIVIIEVIESTVRRTPRALRGCKLKISLLLHHSCHILRPQSTPEQHKEYRLSLFPEDDRSSESSRSSLESERCKVVIKHGSPTELDSKTMMLENERKIQRYKKLRSRIKVAMQVKKRLFSAVYRTPLEIWSHIFTFCLQADEEYIEAAEDSAPLLLCRVCYTWRAAAIRTPALWNSLVISLRGQTTRKAFLQTWIGRSGDLPLSFHILWGPTQSLQFHDRIFDYLLTLAHRWRAIRLSVEQGLVWQAHGFPTRAHKLLSYAMPILDTLEIEPYLSLAGASLQRNAPWLRELRLLNTTINPMHLMVVAPAGGGWTQLACFRSQYPLDTAQAMRVFKICPNLVQCEIAVMSCPPVEPQRGTILLMPKLKRLSIKETSAKVVNAFIRLLELPVLEELDIDAASCFESRISWTATELLFLTHRSSSSKVGNIEKSCKLRQLKVRGVILDEKFLSSVVVGIPSLVLFEMKNKEIDLEGKSWLKLLRTRLEWQKILESKLGLEQL